MLTRIEIDGFKSLQNFSLDLEPFMAIVGVNGAGKSNLFDAMALLSRLASMPVREALKAGRGHIRDQFSITKDGHISKMTFAAEFLLPESVKLPSGRFIGSVHGKVRYEVELKRLIGSGDIEQVLLVREQLFSLSLEMPIFFHGAKDLFSASPSPQISIYLLNDGSPRAFISKTEQFDYSLNNEESVSLDNWMDSLATISETHRSLKNLQFSQVEPSRLRATSEAADATTLARDGSNLPTVFAALSPEVKGRVRANLVRFVPGLRDVEAKQRDDEFYLEVTSTDGRRFPARILSDGTLRILALLTLLYSSPAGSLLALEELENGIYPGRFVDLLEALVEATSPEESGLQILLTSHSPTVIAALKDRPQALAFIDTVSIAGQRVTRVRQIQDAPTDRGATSISRQEVEQILEVSQPEGL